MTTPHPQRPLGAFERLFYRYSERNPLHFAFVAEFPSEIGDPALRAALRAVQARHPLLRVSVEDDGAGGPVSIAPAPVRPIPLQRVADTSAQWTHVAAVELSTPFDRQAAPLVRATLMAGPLRSTILLTFDHTIADGISSALIVEGLVSALNGVELPPLSLPPPQEVMLAQHLPRVPDSALSPDSVPAADPHLSAMSTIRPFDGTPPHLATCEWTEMDTAALVEQCRTHGTTVHSAIVVAASRTFADSRSLPYVRVLSPINFRGLIGNPSDCADYFMAARTGMATTDRASFWDDARDVLDQLRPLRSAQGIRTASETVQSMVPARISAHGAQQFLLNGLSHDLTVTNLGVRKLNSGPVGTMRPDALWGPILLNQIADETVTGVTTYQGRLRMVTTSYTPPGDFLDAMVDRLLHVVR